MTNPFSNSDIQFVEISRKIVYGRHATQKLPQVLRELKIENLAIITGTTATKQIAIDKIIPLLKEANEIEINIAHITLKDPTINDLVSISDSIRENGQKILVCGGGSIIDYTKVIACFSQQEYISVPTSASHDGFSSPYVNFLLRRQLNQAHFDGKPLEYRPTPPIAIVGDTYLIDKEPQKYFASGVGDTLSKITANLDWRLSHRLTGEKIDEYAASFGLLSAKVIEKGAFLLEDGGELATRLVVKALGNAGVAMSIAGSSRPASGSEHLISHYLDLKRKQKNDDRSIPHGMQTGLATIAMLYLHGDPRWRTAQKILKSVKAATTLRELDISQDLFVEAMTQAHNLRDRYTILGKGLTKKAAINTLKATEII